VIFASFGRTGEEATSTFYKGFWVSKSVSNHEKPNHQTLFITWIYISETLELAPCHLKILCSLEKTRGVMKLYVAMRTIHVAGRHPKSWI
jgi:hypothetical protein